MSTHHELIDLGFVFLAFCLDGLELLKESLSGNELDGDGDLCTFFLSADNTLSARSSASRCFQCCLEL